MKSFSFLLVLFFVFSLTAFAQDTSFAVSSNGNVGIGTANPANLLDVNGITNIRGTLRLGTVGTQNIAADNSTLYLRGAGIALQNATASTTYSFFSQSGNSYINALGGNVGIGTTSPLAKLDVRGDIITGVDGSGGQLTLSSNDNVYEGGQISWNGASSYDDWYQDVYINEMRIRTYSSNDDVVHLFNGGSGKIDLRVEDEIQTYRTGDANMVPITYGTISAGGVKYTSGSTDNFTVSKIGTGHYEISINGGFNFTTHVVSCSVYDNELAFITYYDIGTVLRIKTYNGSGASADYYFNFIVYKK